MEAKVGMLIRRAPEDVFEAFADPAITTRFWFTKSSGRLEPGATVRWEWEMYGASADVAVEEIEPGRLIRFDWGAKVRFTFTPHELGTYVEVTESGFGDDVERVAASTGGFTLALAAAKAWLEHDIVLRVVRDRFPEGIER
jgi:uncharacterized protein YndB with AHSA1/START domain